MFDILLNFEYCSRRWRTE